MAARERSKTVERTGEAGCVDCPDGRIWSGGNVQGVAARHHDSTGHRTWSVVTVSVHYGEDPPPGDLNQSSLFDLPKDGPHVPEPQSA